jgi:hypothetical protein
MEHDLGQRITENRQTTVRSIEELLQVIGLADHLGPIPQIFPRPPQMILI